MNDERSFKKFNSYCILTLCFGTVVFIFAGLLYIVTSMKELVLYLAILLNLSANIFFLFVLFQINEKLTRWKK